MTSNTQNETVGISQTIQRALRNAGYGSYFEYAGPVVEALVARENDIAEKLVDYALDAGADELEVRAYLREVGMVVAVREDEPVNVVDDNPEPTSKKKGKQSKRELLEGLSAQVTSLTDFARRNGYRG